MKSQMNQLSSADSLTGDEARAGQLLRAAQRIEPLSELELARLRGRLTAKSMRVHRPTWMLLAAAGVLLVSAASAGYLLLSPTLRSTSPTLRAQKSAAAAAAPTAQKRGLEGPAPEEPVPTTEGDHPGLRPTAQKPSSGRSELRAAPRGLEQEAALMAEALSALRKQGNPGRALALLDTYAREFPQGSLRSEALVARAEALDRLGNSGEALQLLDGATLSAPHLLVLRGNLRAKLNRCDAAIEDYDRALRATNADALIGRAECRLRLGQKEAARSDYESYLKQFPQGRSVARAKAALGAAPR